MVERLKEMWQDVRQMRDERGLTLVELLVVVVILGIIAAISVIAIGGLIENSRKDAQVANAKQLVNAAKLYVASNPVANNTELVHTKTGVANANSVLKPMVDDLKDPMNEDNPYTEAFVTVGKTGETYTYKVTLEGNSTVYFSPTTASITRASINTEPKKTTTTPTSQEN